MRERTEHHFVDGEPEGVRLSVERLKYLGEGSYSLSTLEKWRSAAVLSGVLNVILLLMWWNAGH